jgi:hypothetical protein
MKYKNIDSALHNFGQSFVSLANYLDGDYVVDDVYEAVRHPPHELKINFSTGSAEPAGVCSPRVVHSIALYRKELPEHLQKHGLEPSILKDVTLIHRLTRLGHETVMKAVDDRAKEHSVSVRRSW